MDPGSRVAPPRLAGRQDAFAFSTDLPPGTAGPLGRHVDARLSIERDRLVLQWVPHFHSGTPVGTPPLDDVLLAGVSRLEFSYLYPEGAGRHGWSDEWSEPFLPRLVRTRVTFARAGQMPWPDIVAEPLQDRPGE